MSSSGAATPTDAEVGRHPTSKRRGVHDHDRDQERVLAADEVAQLPGTRAHRNGRIKNPLRMQAAQDNPVVSLTPEKNCFEMIADSAPYR
jgi:hypothetical protein